MKRRRLLIQGRVQGVGFRPFIYRLAHEHNLLGYVSNTSMGVDIDVQGKEEDLLEFQKNILLQKPENSFIDTMETIEEDLTEFLDFSIRSSESREDSALALLPDTAVCSKCYKEFFDPSNRRYGYPFIHCMSCGPRFSLFLRMPFDRKNTSMASFSMCHECQKEYENPQDRRFYSQTICCPACGPKLSFFDCKKNLKSFDLAAINSTVDALREGRIVAMKNTGGYLLLADATNRDTVLRLRQAKRRSKKPFALLMKDINEASCLATISPDAAKVLQSPSAPIVLLERKKKIEMVDLVAFDMPYLGIMLAHNCLQYLISQKIKRPLIATSGNISNHPICMTEEAAFEELSGIADYFLTHNRRIIHRLDDSVVMMICDRPMILRRARGYIPYAFFSQQTECTLATGGHLKNSFAIAKGKKVYISQHIGDLDSCENSHAFDLEINSYESLLQAKPKVAVCDLHPDYYSSRYLTKRKVDTTFVQHHEAHVYSCMLEHQIKGPFLGIAWDGTGLGHDGTIWGGEAFLFQDKMERFATIYPFYLPGSEAAVKEPRRAALGLLEAADCMGLFQFWIDGAFSLEEQKLMGAALQKKINTPQCSSMGRLFDGVSALLDIHLINDFEGQAAMGLEALALQTQKGKNYFLSLIKKDLWILDWREMLYQIIMDKMNREDILQIALGFHIALAQTIVLLAEKASMQQVVLTGGVMQNKLLLEMAIHLLKEKGFTPIWNEAIPPNDGGLAAGQIARLCV